MLNPPIWWALHKNGITLLERPSFIASYYLLLIGIYGLLLGLIPIHRLQELLASSLGKFRFRSNLRPEMALSRPVLWAWAPVGLALVFRMLTFNVRADNSVLGSTAYGEGRYEHFFAPLSLRSTSDLSAWIFDRFVLTGPTLFLFAFSIGVWLRHQFSERPAGPAGRSKIRKKNEFAIKTSFARLAENGVIGNYDPRFNAHKPSCGDRDES
jgi:hypothetical protein